MVPIIRNSVDLLDDGLDDYLPRSKSMIVSIWAEFIRSGIQGLKHRFVGGD